jgi:hypothetical protein
MLLLDEATSMIDAVRILVVHGSAIVAAGTHGELLGSSPRYRDLVRQELVEMPAHAAPPGLEVVAA